MINALLKKHKKTCLIAGNGRAYECTLKPTSTAAGFPLKGVSNFVGATFDENGNGYFGDSFDITLDSDDVREFTNLTPVAGWFITVTFPEYNNTKVTFKIENVAIDRTLGMYLLHCSASKDEGKGKRINRNGNGGI